MKLPEMGQVLLNKANLLASCVTMIISLGMPYATTSPKYGLPGDAPVDVDAPTHVAPVNVDASTYAAPKRGKGEKKEDGKGRKEMSWKKVTHNKRKSATSKETTEERSLY